VGGKRKTPCHLDIPLRHCDIYLDDLAVVLGGDVVAPEASKA
jgi:2,5-dihydroxypyridine 5,6-dioxygenase